MPGYSEFETSQTEDGSQIKYEHMDLYRIPDYEWVSNYDPNASYSYQNEVFGWKNRDGCLTEWYKVEVITIIDVTKVIFLHTIILIIILL